MKLYPGNNIAIKVPAHQFDRTVMFYRDVVGLQQLKQNEDSIAFEFKGKTLWLDRRDDFTRAEIWLEIRAEDIEVAATHMSDHGITRRDDVEQLPDEFRGFWIANAAGIIHLVSSD